ncbi:helix-turn-helix domain-containing protein [Enterovirga aerilata]|uniref:Helix-turn-helix domain-containing protein n=1 Tax=Enterovirga aerilata TaxID=2730920 RepID=A0A849I2X8_9HYPH|nr:helix-turn-helix domain-containing protein [Enterovirga sp. DB1703]NNM71701.1 helix-turn-helix domain-containing protein [Enterovirga sp. DB1703]
MRLDTNTLNTARPAGGAALPPSGLPEIALFAGCPELIGSPFSYAREEEVYGEGEETEYVYKIVSGAVRTCRILADGRRQIHGFHLPGDLFGFEPGQTHRLTAEAIADTRVLMFKRRQLERIATRNVEVACQLWTMTARNLQHAEEHMLLLGRRTALERVAAFIIEMDARLGGTGSIELPMSRRDIADYLGLTLETVSRSVSQLQQDRALALSGARRVVLNRPAMSRIVED